MAVLPTSISTEYITLDAFLKWAGVADTGGHAKVLITSGDVYVNGEPERRRGRKLRPGDQIKVAHEGHWLITREEE
jgi:ribosome-associated protein